MLFSNDESLQHKKVAQEIERLLPSRIPLIPSKEELELLLSLLDLTTLEGTDNAESVDLLCRKALGVAEKGFKGPAAICIYTPFIKQVRAALSGTGITTACVAGYFPSGQAPIQLKLEEIKFACEEGAEEIDIVIPRGKMLAGEDSAVFDEISAMREAAKNVHLKVILETGELKMPSRVQKASEIAIAAGADFIKTSTGKVQPAATEDAAVTMLHVIRTHFNKTGNMIGFKPAGGISDPVQAYRYLTLVKNIAGISWLSPDLFRIGASRLADNLLKELLS
ncbi:MAG: deoxyribose-phosphate aldolase [Bacteroidota bacterium]